MTRVVPSIFPADFTPFAAAIVAVAGPRQVDHSIDLSEEFDLAFSPSGATVYVQPVTGSDPVTDLNTAYGTGNCYATITRAYAAAGIREIVLLDGLHPVPILTRALNQSGGVARPIRIRAANPGKAIVTNIGSTLSGSSWTASGSGYTWTPAIARAAHLILHNGVMVPFYASASAAIGSGFGWYQDLSSKQITLRVGNANINSIKTELVIHWGAGANTTFTGTRTYVEGVVFGYGTAIEVLNDGSTPAHVYMKDCEVAYAAPYHGVHGVGSHVFTQNVYSHHSAAGDGFNYDAASGLPGIAVEIDNRAIVNGTLFGSRPFVENSYQNKQGSSAHDGVYIMRIGGEYHSNYSQNICDTNPAGGTWNIGCDFRAPYPGPPIDAARFQGPTWNDSCISGGASATYGAVADQTATVKHYNCVMDGTIAPTLGTIGSYTPDAP